MPKSSKFNNLDKARNHFNERMKEVDALKLEIENEFKTMRENYFERLNKLREDLPIHWRGPFFERHVIYDNRIGYNFTNNVWKGRTIDYTVIELLEEMKEEIIEQCKAA